MPIISATCLMKICRKYCNTQRTIEREAKRAWRVMAGKLELRRGVVEPISSTTKVQGSEHSVSSTIVTMFELDGAVTQYSGSMLPFRAGDKAIVAGHVARSGVFQAYAVRLPQKNLVFGETGRGMMVFGILLGLIGATIAAVTAAGIATALIFDSSEVGQNIAAAPFVLIPLVVGSVFAYSGLAIVRKVNRARQARRMVESA